MLPAQGPPPKEHALPAAEGRRSAGKDDRAPNSLFLLEKDKFFFYQRGKRDAMPLCSAAWERRRSAFSQTGGSFFRRKNKNYIK